ncbi:MAG: CRTAC1 family protein [Planctomycetes bacterium]|nr:CRTAC1 family protein [Planctomycetota bacterium]
MLKVVVAVLALAAIASGGFFYYQSTNSGTSRSSHRHYSPRESFDTSGFTLATDRVKAWDPNSLESMSAAWKDMSAQHIPDIDRLLLAKHKDERRLKLLRDKAFFHNYDGQPAKAYAILEEMRALADARDDLAEKWLYSIIFLEGITALRQGEDANCVLCRGESSCIIPIDAAAVHIHPEGSQTAIKHFTEYLEQFPDDLGVKWLLNLAHMTLGEHPSKVDLKHVLNLDPFFNSEFDIGKFRDIGHLAGVNRFNMAGGAIMEDFDNDGLLDIVITSMDPTERMVFYRNKGDGAFEDRTKAAGLDKQLGGLYCVQTDYNNDGHMDIFIPRGAWLKAPMRPSLLRNNGDGTFTDVTIEAGLIDKLNSITASWIDFDNDGFLDLYICCDRQANRLYRNKGDGTFEEVAAKAGVQGNGRTCKGAAWIDYDNDGYPDLFLNYLGGSAQLFHNNRDGTFSDVTEQMGINGPRVGFSCWAFDFDNDGWLDIFATSFDRTLDDVIKGLMGLPHERHTCKLYRNKEGKGFEDVTKEVGLDGVYSTMGSNFADFDNDGYLDMYLGTGDPSLATLVPNRMFKNVAGKRFADISTSSRTGHLQKGHAVACGDWNNNGTVDIFIEMGGATNGDKYHNVLFQNPGQGNNWLTVKLVGKKTNRPAIGARIKATIGGDELREIHRHVSSGSSFGANPLRQTLGLGKATRVDLLEIRWPTSGTTQVFRDVPINQFIEITEFARDYRKLDLKPIAAPK